MFDPAFVTEVTTDSWEEFHDDLVATFADIGRDGGLNVIAPRPGSPRPTYPHTRVPRMRRFREWLRPELRDYDPVVAFFRLAEWLHGWISGPAQIGGYSRWSAEQEADLIALGWRDSRRDERGSGYPGFRVFFPFDGVPSKVKPFPLLDGTYPEIVDFAHAARLTIDTLRGPFGVQTPRGLFVERGAERWRRG